MTFPFATYTPEEIEAKLAGARAVVTGYENGARAPELADYQREYLLRLARGFVARWEWQLAHAQRVAQAEALEVEVVELSTADREQVSGL